ncbi:MAG: transcription elongation factor GreB [Myxococcus sp.]|nr:transcription elongation factor GreB [Myxococcus sp.]
MAPRRDDDEAEPTDDEGLLERDEDEAEDARPKGTLYITPAGAEKLKAELKELLTVERPKVTAEVSAAAALGDRSENAEYIYGKRRLREIDRRLRFLQKRVEGLTVVDPTQQKDPSRVFFGATVTLQNEEDETRTTYQLVGPDETELKSGRISIDSPVARALIGKRQGDSVTVMRPKGEADFTVLTIRYV